MLKFLAALEAGAGKLYGFALTESDLNRLEFNQEAFLFDFGYAGQPQLFGLIVCLPGFEQPEDIASQLDLVKRYCVPFFDVGRGITPETLHFFPLATSVIQKFRDTPFWGFDGNIQITQPGDRQIFFAGRDDKDIKQYLKGAGLLKPQTKQTTLGFGKVED